MSTVFHTPAAIRDAARRARTEAIAHVRAAGKAESLDAIIAAAIDLAVLNVIPCEPDSELLQGDRGKIDHDRGVIVIDETLTDEERRFTVPHELGHAKLDLIDGGCAGVNLDAPILDAFPFGEQYVTGYGPRQQAEINASLFAAEFVAPLDLVRAEFLNGRPASDIAAGLGVSVSVVYGQLTAAFLTPEGMLAMLPDRESSDETEVNAAPEHSFELHPQQKEARDAGPGPTPVSAGPGTGKTRTLTERVVHLIRNREVPPEGILCLTFSNKAAGELRDRCERAVGAEARQVRVQTFHAFGLDLLRDYPEQAGVRNDVTLLDRLDAEDLLDRHLVELDLLEYRNIGDPVFYLPAILDAISAAKDEMVSPERYMELARAAAVAAPSGDDAAQKAARRHVEVARIYAKYDALLQQHGAVDFGDLIYRVVRLFESHAEVAEEVSNKYPHILVDEYQDVNRASARLLQLLRPSGQGLWVVGDVRQAIYAFRGASARNLSEFAKDFPAAGEPVPLVRNYRSAPELVRVFSSAAKAMQGGDGFADWEPDRVDARGIAIFATAENEEAELAAIVERISSSVAAGRTFAAHAVLCHRNADVQRVARALERQGIPVANFGNFFEREEVLDLLSLLAYAVEYGATALPRVRACGPHALDDADFRALLDAALHAEGGIPTVLNAATLPEGMSEEGFRRASSDWRALTGFAFRREVWTFFAGYLFDDGRYLRAIVADGTARARARQLAIGQLLLMARAFDAREEKVVPALVDEDDSEVVREGVEGHATTPASIARKRAFLRFMRRLWSARDRRVPVPTSAIDAVHVGTVHGAKGLEFPAVFIPFLVENRFPFKAPPDFAPPPPGMLPADALADEAELEALFFVAMTRARDELVLSHARSYGGKPPKPSRLLRLVAQARAHGLFDEQEWAVTAAAVESAGELSQPRELSFIRYTEFDAYLDCPRRYYYRHVLDLPEPDDGRAYLGYHTACRTVSDWLDEVHRAGAMPDDWGSVEERFDSVWNARGPSGHAHEGFYREAALGMVRQAWERRRGMVAAPEWDGAPMRLVSTIIDGVTVTIPVSLSRDEGGLVRIGHNYFRPNKDKDRSDHRFALLRRAFAEKAGGRSVQIEAHYPEGVETFAALRSDAEKRRIDAVSKAVAGIKAGRFPAEPSEDRERACPRCPYGLICPS